MGHRARLWGLFVGGEKGSRATIDFSKVDGRRLEFSCHVEPL